VEAPERLPVVTGSPAIPPGEPAEIDPRFEEYQRSRERNLRNDLVESNRGLAERVARRYVDRGEPLDDLVQVAMVGLLKAVERFDPRRGLAFSAFAVPTMTGEIRRYFRDRTWTVKVPRRTQEIRQAIGPASERLQQELGRPPTPVEVATLLGHPVDEVLEALAAGSAYRPGPLVVDPSAPREREPELRDDAGERWADDLALRDLVVRLPDRERTIVELRFFGELTQAEIAERLGLSQMHVSRLLRRTLLLLRSQLRQARTDEH
jgi:RNA polymerase sigma-B factor